MKKEYIVPDTEIIDFQLMDIVVTDTIVASGLGDLDLWEDDENGKDIGVSDGD